MVFSLNKDGTDFQVVHSFCDGSEGALQPNSTLLESADGYLYGTVAYVPGGFGGIYRVQKSGASFSLTHTFENYNNAGAPQSGLVFGPDGAIYGSTEDQSAIYKINADSTGTGFQILQVLNSPLTGGGTFAAPFVDTDGSIYSSTTIGGCGLEGVLCKTIPTGSGTRNLQLLHCFGLSALPSDDGITPYGSVIKGCDGAIYGTTAQSSFPTNGEPYNYGTVYKINTDGSGYRVLYRFSNGATGGVPYDGLLLGSNGGMYLTTTMGGAYGHGTLVELGCPGVTNNANPCCTNAVITTNSTITNSLIPLSVTRTWTVTTSCGFTTNGSQTITLLNNLTPIILCSNMMVLSCSNVPVNYTTTAVEPNCTNITLIFSPTNGTVFASGTTNPVHCVATDCCGNTNFCDFSVTVVCPTNPCTLSVTYPSQIVICTPTNCVLLPDETYQISVTSLAGGVSIKQNIPAGSSLCGNTNLTFTVTNSCGFVTNVIVPVILVIDQGIPVITSAPSNIVLCPCNSTAGPIIVNNDEWTLSDSGFNTEGTANGNQFAANCAAYLAAGKGNKVLIYSTDFGFTGNDFASSLAGAGYIANVQAPNPAVNLNPNGYNVIFVGGDALSSAQIQVLQSFVLGGGGIYVAAGTGRFGSAAVEALQWNALLNPYGLTLAGTFNGVITTYPVNSAHPVLAGVSLLENVNGQDVSLFGNSSSGAQIIATLGTDGLLGVAAGCTGGSCARMTDQTGLVIVQGGANGASVFQSIPIGTLICGNTNVTFTVSNSCGYLTNLTVPVRINTNKPIILCSNMAVAACSNGPVFYTTTATEANCTNITLAFSPTNGTTFVVGTTNTVHCVVTDCCGNTNFCDLP